jgi:phosphatidylethanolamine-binding protein (PEBP) family uncharacterized protein
MKYNTKKKNNNLKNKTKKTFLFNPENPKKSFDVYIDKNPSDTINIKYTTLEDVKNTIDKLEKLYKNKKYSHKRIWQVGMIMYVRLKVLRNKKAKQYALANKYFNFLGKRTKLEEKERYKLSFTDGKNKTKKGGNPNPSFSINYANIGKTSIGNVRGQDLTGKADAYKTKPKITLNTDVNDNSKGKKYSVIMLDPDAPDSKGTSSTWTHWFVTISSDGTIINEHYPYQPPSPPPGSGQHRYIFNLYDDLAMETKKNNNSLAGNDYYTKVIEPLLQKVRPITKAVQYTVTSIQ